MSPAKRTTTAKSTRTKKTLDREVSLPSETDQTQTDTSAIADSSALADSSPLADSYSRDGSADDLEERIRQKAYQIYCSRHGSDGNAMEDWLAAEREVRLGRSAAERTGHAQSGNASSLIESVSEDAQQGAQPDVAG